MIEDANEQPDITSVIAAMDVPLDDHIYDDVHGHLSLEVRDFSRATRTLVLRFWLEGRPHTVMVDWEQFIHAFDAMRAGMMPTNWDDALNAIQPGDDPR